MKVVYINASFGVRRYLEPLGISYLAAALRQACIPGLEVVIYEPSVLGESLEAVVEKVLSMKADYIGLSFITGDMDCCRTFLTAYRSKWGKAKFLVGGNGPSLEPDKFLIPGVDAVFIGEGEISTVKFFQAVCNQEGYGAVPGILYRNEQGEPVRNQTVPRIENLDELPFMERDILRQLCQLYPGEVSARIISSRGCYMFCEYCAIHSYVDLQEGKLYRERSVTSLIAEMKYLYETYNVRQFLFEDDNFLPRNVEKALEKTKLFCYMFQELHIPNPKLHMQFRPDSVTREIIERLKECGLCDLFIGIENINQEDMDFFGRKADVKQHLQIMRELRELGFSCNVNSKHRLRIGYIMFNPESTKETLSNSVRFLKEFEVTPKKLVNMLRPYPHTKIREKFLDRRYLSEDGTIHFKDAMIGEVATCVIGMVRKILGFRESLRLPVKLNRELNLDYDQDVALQKLDQLRARCDDMCYQVFEEMLKVREEMLSSVVACYEAELNQMKEDIAIQQLLSQLKKEMHVESMEVGIYR